MEEIEITFYMDEESKNEYDNPNGVIAAACVFDGDTHCTGDVRFSMYLPNVTLVFSDITKDGILKKTLDNCVNNDIYRTEVHKVKCHIQRSHYDFFIIKKTDIALWKK